MRCLNALLGIARISTASPRRPGCDTAGAQRAANSRAPRVARRSQRSRSAAEATAYDRAFPGAEPQRCGISPGKAKELHCAAADNID